MGIIENHPGTFVAENAWSFLPFVVYKMGGNFDELISYINEDEDDTMYFKKIETMARIHMIQEDYLEAIAIFEQIINEQSIGVNARLLAELDQAYCYAELAESGTRALLPRATRMPKKYSEYLDIRDEIMNKLHQSILAHPEPEVTIPEVMEFTVSNYPNPFNPTTTIHFTVATNQVTGNSGQVTSSAGVYQPVSVNIYNIRGQRVRSLVNGVYPVGQHSVVWNGSDDSGRSVGSGIYMYRVTAGEHSTVRKMLLIK